VETPADESAAEPLDRAVPVPQPAPIPEKIAIVVAARWSETKKHISLT
jgi:hypothetical protein